MARFRGSLRRLPLWFAALALCLISGECVARLDDWIFQDVPFLASPDRERDLIAMDRDGVPRGRPNGRFKKYKLNSLGFRGPEMSADKPANTIRVFVLGASETFGLYESDDHEYPALLREAFKSSASNGVRIEVVNTAMAATPLPVLTEYWRSFLKDLHPDVVLIYPSPPFYVDNEPPKGMAERGGDARAADETAAPLRSRFLERLKDTAKQPEWIRSLRARYVLARELAGKDDAWFFRTVPGDRLERYRRDLEALASEIAASGARPIVITHAFKTPSPPEPRDLAELNAYRIFFPRAEPAVIPAFDAAARQATIDLGRERGWPVIDASAELSGKRDLFADPVHFNDDGSRAMAELLARQLRPLLKTIEEGR
jgi:lysophospholipase L1-like esterase